MKFMQIGNGAAFNTEMTNSSFLFNCGNEYLLFDCGYNVFSKLISCSKNNEIDITKLKKVYISHMDDDHIGSLRSLLYYQYFTNNIVMDIYACSEVFYRLKTYLVNLCEHNGVVENYKKVYKTLFNLNELELGNYKQVNNFQIKPIKAHHYQPSYGLSLNTTKIIINISSDTVACKELNEEFKGNILIKDQLIFHDYSFWDCPENQVHACETNINKFYDSIIRDGLNYYHNNLPYLSNWFSLDKNLEKDFKLLKKV